MKLISNLFVYVLTYTKTYIDFSAQRRNVISLSTIEGTMFAIAQRSRKQQ